MPAPAGEVDTLVDRSDDRRGARSEGDGVDLVARQQLVPGAVTSTAAEEAARRR